MALLRIFIHPKPFIEVCQAYWLGRKHESDTLLEYCKHMNTYGHAVLKATKCGFKVHPTRCGASPDTSIHDPSCNDFHHGIAEFKCPDVTVHLCHGVLGHFHICWCNVTLQGVSVHHGAFHNTLKRCSKVF